MENQFKNALNGIRTLMTTVLQSIRAAGRMDDNTIAEFGEKLRTEIIVFKRVVVVLRQEIPDERTIEKLMHYKLDELLDIMGSPHPEYVKAGFYVSPDKPTDPVYFWAYQDLWELAEWIQESCSHDPAKSAVLTQAAEAVARREFDELATAADEFYVRGINPELIKTLMQPYSRFKSPRATGLRHRELVNLRKLKAAILDSYKIPDDKIEEALHTLLYALNVNTDTSITYCKNRLQKMLDHASTHDARLKVLALEKKLIGQATIKANMEFDPYNLRLMEEIVKYIKEEHDFRVEHPEPSTQAEPVTYPIPDAEIYVKLGVSNEQHAAQMRSMHAVGYFKGLDKDIIELTGRLVLSNRDKTLGMQAYRSNFYDATVGGAHSAFNMNMRQFGWMTVSWRELGIPDVTAMNAYDLQKFVLSFIPPSTSSK